MKTLTDQFNSSVTWTGTNTTVWPIQGQVAVSAAPQPKPARTPLEWLDERIDEMRKAGRLA